MEKGMIPPPRDHDWNKLRLGWKQIMHRDLKPPNVFLDEPDPERYRFYPKVSILYDIPLYETDIVPVVAE